MASYNYTSLKADEAIRILVLEPAEARDDVLRGSLVEEELGSGANYEALLYVWGEDIHLYSFRSH